MEDFLAEKGEKYAKWVLLPSLNFKVMSSAHHWGGVKTGE
jgi:hypothetical protein